jgi:hypothetical protein
MPQSQPFNGKFRFPGPYATLERPGIPDNAILQFDTPFSGIFNDLAARNTFNQLQAGNQDGDGANLTGLICDCQVSGQNRPVLFLFN